jgi:hypothetical protein
MVVRIILAALLCLSSLTTVLATPARIIILRHGEKATAYKLCDIGRGRAKALITTYLGRGAAKSLFPSGEAPVAILAITLHTLRACLAVSCELGRAAYVLLRVARQGRR